MHSSSAQCYRVVNDRHKRNRHGKVGKIFTLKGSPNGDFCTFQTAKYMKKLNKNDSFQLNYLFPFVPQIDLTVALCSNNIDSNSDLISQLKFAILKDAGGQ